MHYEFYLLFVFWKFYAAVANIDESRQESIRNKFVLTSTISGSGKPLMRTLEEGCLRVDVSVPDTNEPLPLCLKLKTGKDKLAGFDKNFKLVISTGNNDVKKMMSVHDVMSKEESAAGYVIGIGLSCVNGYFRNNEFYGTLTYAHFSRKQIILCSILPINLLSEFVDLSKMNEKGKADFILTHMANREKSINPNAIVTCNDIHGGDGDDEDHPFAFTGFGNPTNIRLKLKSPRRQRRQAPLPPEMSDASAMEYGPYPLPAPIPRDLVMPDNSNSKPETPTKEDIKVKKVMSKFLRPEKHGTHFAAVCYIIDADYLTRRFNGSAEEATLLLSGYVELADWILRSTDWNQDGIPDNIGVRLLEVSVEFITRELKSPDEKWGRSENGTFWKRGEIFGKIRQLGKYLNPDCDIRSGIGEINTARYVLHEPGGCTACKHNKLTSFVNPYTEKFSQQGEQIRLMFNQIRILTFALVHTNGFCTNCTVNRKKVKEQTSDSIMTGTFESRDKDWGACIVESDVQSSSNIPLNSFRLSVCSKNEGLSCLKELASRNNCMQFEPEESYCGNGIIEADEECDCGSLATCAEQQCTCSPRTGRDPCRKLSPELTKICFKLIRCRGYRFLFEVGKADGSNFLQAFNRFADGREFKIGELSLSGEGRDEKSSKAANMFLDINAICCGLPLIVAVCKFICRYIEFL